MLPPNVTDIKTAADAEWEQDRADAAAFRRIGQAGWVLTRQLAEPIDYRQCPRPECGSRETMIEFFHSEAETRVDYWVDLRYCTTCHRLYRVTFRAVRVEAE